jgi:hypothetical protein
MHLSKRVLYSWATGTVRFTSQCKDAASGLCPYSQWVRVAVRMCSPLLEQAAKQTLRDGSQVLSRFNRISTALTFCKCSDLYPLKTLGAKKTS